VEALLRRGQSGTATGAFSLGELRVDRAARTVTRGVETLPLAPKELDLLLALFLKLPWS